jgi:hypothetical protein
MVFPLGVLAGMTPFHPGVGKRDLLTLMAFFGECMAVRAKMPRNSRRCI